MRSTVEAAPAKINLFLDVLSRREDGYHNIVSIMQSVGLSDIIKIDTASSGGINVFCDNPGIPGGEMNIAHRAASLFCRAASISPGLEITVEKNIPSPAGLGGGSSDAAAVLRALNRLYGGVFGYQTLCRMGLSVGADVPFCIRGGCARVTETGGVLERTPPLPECHIVIGCGGEGVSTPAAYAALDVMYESFVNRREHGGHYALEAAAAAVDVAGVCGSLYNIFEDAVLPRHPQASEIKKIMSGGGALACLMSGSGPSVFGIFSDISAASLARDEILAAGFAAHICAPAPEFRI